MRNPNGYGTTYKLSGKRRRPWIARVTTGWEDKKQLFYTVGYYETRAKAMAALAEYHKNPIGERGDILLKDLYEEWAKVRYPKLSKKTIDTYTTAWNHLMQLEKDKFKDIKTSHIQAIIDDMDLKGPSRSSCHKVKVLAGLLYKYALADDIVDRNYAEMVELPSEEKKVKEIFTDIEIKIMESKVDEIEWMDTILIFIYTGMRITELLTLTKFNIDLENGFITGGIKTDAGKDRIIPIHPKIYSYVEKWYNTKGSYLINKDGVKISVDHYRRAHYYTALEKAGVRKLTPHKARHTFASLLNKAGVDKTYIQKLVGHANYSTTANIYTHPDFVELKKAIEMI